MDLHYISHKITDDILGPIGSVCIRKFEYDDFNEDVDMAIQVRKLYEHYRDSEYIDLWSGFFSRRLIEYLYVDGCIMPSIYNGNDAIVDMNFLLDMFNKGRYGKHTDNQKKKLTTMMSFVVAPYLESKFKG